MKSAKLTSFTINNYYGSLPPSGTGSIQFDGGTMTFSLDEPGLQDVMALIFKLVLAKKEAIAEAVMNLETPMLLTSDAQTIEGASLQPPDDIPF